MRFANLAVTTRPPVGALLTPTNTVDETALLKARTLLAFLHHKELLHTFELGLWIVYSKVPQTTGAVTNADADAVIPYLQHRDIREQPGLAIVRNTFETVTLFRDVYLRSSLDWLNERPALVAELTALFEVPNNV